LAAAGDEMLDELDLWFDSVWPLKSRQTKEVSESVPATSASRVWTEGKSSVLWRMQCA